MQVITKFAFMLFLGCLITSISAAQECGPSCPVCSGSQGGALLAPGTLLMSGIYIPGGEDETGVVNLRYGVFSWLDIGAGYTVEAERPIWSLRLQPIPEKEKGWRPAFIVGTGSVQTGNSDQSVFAQVTKGFEFSEVFALRLSGGITSLIPDFERGYGLAGVTLTVTERFSPFASYDGRNTHLGLAWIPTDWMTISGLLIESKEPGVSLAYRFNILE